MSGVGARRAGAVAGIASLLAAGTAVGLAAERYAIGRIRRTDGELEEPFGLLPADRTRTVETEDGVTLRVEEVGPVDAPLTAVFVHGYCLSMGSWHYQRQGLAGPDLRMVFYDQRRHGRSGRAPSETATIDQLGRDLAVVLDEVVPAGPAVLVGHSMGGMTLMALADQYPERFSDRIVGVALLSTSTGRLAEVTLGMPAALARLRAPVLPLVLRGMRSRAALIERSRRIGSDIAWLFTRRYSFGSTDVSPALVEYVGELIAATSVEVIADFFPALTAHDKLAALEVLKSVETLILVGDKDLLTPMEHSEAMADVLPDADLVVVDGAGHLAMMERPDLVNLLLDGFLQRATALASRRRASRRGRRRGLAGAVPRILVEGRGLGVTGAAGNGAAGSGTDGGRADGSGTDGGRADGSRADGSGADGSGADGSGADGGGTDGGGPDTGQGGGRRGLGWRGLGWGAR